MTGQDTVLFTDDERGDTVPRWVRHVIRFVALALLLSLAAAIALARQQMAPADRAPVASTPRVDAPVDLGHEADLLGREDARLRAISIGRTDLVHWVDGTLVLGTRRAPYGVQDLVDRGAMVRTSPTGLMLVRPVVARRGAHLVLHAPGTTLRMVSGHDRFTSLVAWGGSIALSGEPGAPLTVEGWDARGRAADDETADGRAYVLVKDGTLRVDRVRVDHLGFWSGRTAGLALTGTAETVASGRLTHVRAGDVHMGFYASGSHHLVVRDLDVVRPERHGVEITNRSASAVLRGVTVTRPGEDGVSVSNGTSDVTLVGLTVRRSGEYGLRVDGSPLADGPNSAGYAIGNYGGLRVIRARLAGNAWGAALVRSMDRVSLQGSTLTGARSALVVEGASRGLDVRDSTLDSRERSGLVLTGGVRGARLTGSTVTGASVAVDVTDSTLALDDNAITVGTGHGVQASGRHTEVVLGANTIDGRGSGAVDVRDGATITADEQPGGSWTYRPTAFLWAEAHSAALPMLGVLVLPLLGLAFVLRRRRQQGELRRLFEQALVSQGRVAIASYDAAAGSAPGAEPAPAPAARPAPLPAQPGGEPRPGVLAGRHFADARAFAVAAATEAGYSPAQVARALRLPTSRVSEWLEEPADVDRELADAVT
ncbi:right-handed parallel beta-helix repeat-containing protein [Nocardioides sp. LS1]|uniref:right-handed parallel beta-helix repeat-containing protein n=1 Tax=Nocardioides sp. LS1 TaxID=1027620 RepID=UPI000F622D5C|nr:right-handed parallel beta-helix repeat-containing protein [Nocardioides sp. LS1]GCD92235.1 hypothetical protein NLS1_42410 [Nocardioides sp. LS1]